LQEFIESNGGPRLWTDRLRTAAELFLRVNITRTRRAAYALYNLPMFGRDREYALGGLFRSSLRRATIASGDFSSTVCHGRRGRALNGRFRRCSTRGLNGTGRRNSARRGRTCGGRGRSSC
jgi:hypothetical protein